MKNIIKENGTKLLIMGALITIWILLEFSCNEKAVPPSDFTEDQMKKLNEKKSAKENIFRASLALKSLDSTPINDSQILIFSLKLDTLTIKE